MTEQVKCEKCGASVLAAKAFCPECGNAMVDEETRKHTSEHDRYDSTMFLSKSSYNLMLSDMDLNISEAPNLTAENINISKELKGLTLPPLQPLAPSKGTGPAPAKPASSSRTGLIIALLIALVILAGGLILMLFIIKPFSG